jgi:hypothetical protein
MTSFRIAAAALLLVALAGCKNTDENVPIAVIFTPSTTSGDAPITYILRSRDTQFARIEPQYSVDGGRTFLPATRGPGGDPVTGLQASPGGTQHVFLWDTLADLGPGRHVPVVFRIVPFESGHGTDAVTAGFTVDNTDIFVAAASLALPRAREAAAGTASGGAAVAGGAGFATETEVYVPTRNAFERRADLGTARESAGAATLLADDSGETEPRPVVAGGLASGGASASVEAYDEGEDRWIGAPELLEARTGPTLTRLADGTRALVAGGKSGASFVAQDEVIDTGGAPAAVSGGLQAARTGHSATLLPDGTVLVAGGTTSAGVTASTLIYDPGANSYRTGPPLGTPRTGHAAAVAGGKLYVFGGRDAAGNVLRSGEVLEGGAFVPTRDAGGATTQMTTPRERFTATPLGAGEVLLAGGSDGTRELASAERFDAASGAYTPTRGGLSLARSDHRATPFGTGRVLITGGGTAAAEVYIPAARPDVQSFDPETTTTPAPRAEHAVAALLDGRALFTGGTDGVVEGGRLRTLASAEIFDIRRLPPATHVTATADMTTPRRLHTATTLADGTVLIAGGIDESGAALASLELFDPAAAAAGGATFTALAEALPAPVHGQTATRVASGKVVFAGGFDAGGAPTDAAAVFTPGPPRAVAAATLLAPRARHTATLLADGVHVLVAGGMTSGGTALDTAELFDASAGTSAAVGGTLGGARFDHRAVLLDSGKVLILGGRATIGGAPLASAALYDPGTNSLSAVAAPIGEGRADFAAFALPGGKALLAGGIVGPAPAGAPDLASPVTASAVIFDPAAGTATPPVDRDLARPRRGMATAVLGDGRPIISGGRAPSGATVGGFEIYTP